MKSFERVSNSCFYVNVQAISLYMILTEPRKEHRVVSLSFLSHVHVLSSQYHNIICPSHNLVSHVNRTLSFGN